MLVALVVLLMLAETPFDSSGGSRVSFCCKTMNGTTAMAELDRADLDDPLAFEANNLYYLRGRIAAEQNDWARALDDFTQNRPDECPSSAWRFGTRPMQPYGSAHGTNGRANDRRTAVGLPFRPDDPAGTTRPLANSPLRSSTE